MSEKHSIASKLRWSRMSQEERTTRMRAAANARWSVASLEAKYLQALKMVAGRQAKRREKEEGSHD